MANLKEDLVAMIQNEKYYAEQDLNRLTYENSLPYEQKITQISDLLAHIALVNSKLILIDQYYQVRQPEISNPLTNEQIKKPVVGPVDGQVLHGGQSHRE